MGAIRETSSGQTRVLEFDYFVGRANPPKCALMLEQPHVSNVHAHLRWTGQAWELKDLGSRNGTYLDGRRMDRGSATRLQHGSKLGFGRVENEWQVIDETAPTPMAVPLDGASPVPLEAEVIALPSTDNPNAMIFRSAEGGWLLERADEPDIPLINLQTFGAVGRVWRFSCPEAFVATLAASADGARELSVANLGLLLSVSQDEEYVHLRVAAGSREIDMGASVYNYLLLTLARQRIADASHGQPETSCGWVDLADYPHDPMMATPQLNVAVHRIRQQFARVGIADSATIIERRPNVGQLRVGTGHLSITRL